MNLHRKISELFNTGNSSKSLLDAVGIIVMTPEGKGIVRYFKIEKEFSYSHVMGKFTEWNIVKVYVELFPREDPETLTQFTGDDIKSIEILN